MLLRSSGYYLQEIYLERIVLGTEQESGGGAQHRGSFNVLQFQQSRNFTADKTCFLRRQGVSLAQAITIYCSTCPSLKKTHPTGKGKAGSSMLMILTGGDRILWYMLERKGLLGSSPEILGLKRAFWSAGSAAKLCSACNACSASRVSISRVSHTSLLSPIEFSASLCLQKLWPYTKSKHSTFLVDCQKTSFPSASMNFAGVTYDVSAVSLHVRRFALPCQVKFPMMLHRQ